MKVQGLHIVFFIFTIFFSLNSFSQITTTNAAPYNTPDYLVTDVLLGSGMTASNFTWQSAPDNIGYFDGTNANVGFENGVLLCTGGIDFVTGGFGGGADFVMSGGFFSGHTESGGELVEEEGKQYKMFYGMSSDTAMKKYAGGVANYRTSEGKKVLLEHKGPVINTILDILGVSRFDKTVLYIFSNNLYKYIGKIDVCSINSLVLLLATLNAKISSSLLFNLIQSSRGKLFKKPPSI